MTSCTHTCTWCHLCDMCVRKNEWGRLSCVTNSVMSHELLPHPHHIMCVWHSSLVTHTWHHVSFLIHWGRTPCVTNSVMCHELLPHPHHIMCPSSFILTNSSLLSGGQWHIDTLSITHTSHTHHTHITHTSHTHHIHPYDSEYVDAHMCVYS